MEAGSCLISSEYYFLFYSLSVLCKSL